MSEEGNKEKAPAKDGGDELAEKAFFDEELAALPPPPKRRSRNPWFMGIVVVLSILILWWFRFEVLYFFSSSEPVDLGSAVELDPDALPSNAYVTVETWPNPTRAVKFQRRFRETIYRVVPAVGQKKLFIQTERLPEAEGEAEETHSSDVSQLDGRYTGRLISFGDLESTFLTRSGYKSVRLFFREKLFVEITDDCYLLIDGATPRSFWGYLLLALVVAGFGLANAVLLARTLSQRLRKR
jgi:hypothetical protein